MVISRVLAPAANSRNVAPSQEEQIQQFGLENAKGDLEIR